MLVIIYKAASRKLNTTKWAKTKNLQENHFKVYNVKEVEQPALPRSGIMFYLLFFSPPKVFWCSLEYLGNPSKTWANFSKPSPTQYCAANAQSKTVKTNITRSSNDEYSTDDQAIILGKGPVTKWDDFFGKNPTCLWPPPLIFGKLYCNFYNGYGRIYARRHRPHSIS